MVGVKMQKNVYLKIIIVYNVMNLEIYVKHVNYHIIQMKMVDVPLQKIVKFHIMEIVLNVKMIIF